MIVQNILDVSFRTVGFYKLSVLFFYKMVRHIFENNRNQ